MTSVASFHALIVLFREVGIWRLLRLDHCVLQNGKFLQLASTFLGGFAVAFGKGWKLTLVMVATIPLLILSGGLMAKVMSRMSSEGQQAYAEAGTTVEQVVGSIRTVRNPRICLHIQSSNSDQSGRKVSGTMSRLIPPRCRGLSTGSAVAFRV